MGHFFARAKLYIEVYFRNLECFRAVARTPSGQRLSAQRYAWVQTAYPEMRRLPRWLLIVSGTFEQRDNNPPRDGSG